MNEVLHMSLKVNKMCLSANFNILIGIDEGPDVLESSSEEMISLISLSGGVKNEEFLVEDKHLGIR